MSKRGKVLKNIKKAFADLAEAVVKEVPRLKELPLEDQAWILRKFEKWEGGDSIQRAMQDLEEIKNRTATASLPDNDDLPF